MKLVVDIQALQGASANRGIGRYTLGLVRGLLTTRGAHDVVLVGNDRNPDALGRLERELGGLLPQGALRMWRMPGGVAGLDRSQPGLRQAAERLREAFLASLSPDFVLVASLFEGLHEDIVTSVSVSVSGSGPPTAVVFYDLIPWLFQEAYLAGHVEKAWYEEKLSALGRADLLLAISEASLQELRTALPDFKARPGTSISSACDARFTPAELQAADWAALQRRYGVNRHFILYTGGFDPRKNMAALVRAFAALPEALRRNRQLVIACAASDVEIVGLYQRAREAGLAEGELILTGHVPDEDLLSLYRGCELFVFPSLHEGFGLPALEAMACGRPVIASNTSSLPEVVGREDALFDPKDVAAITAAMERVLGSSRLQASLRAHGLARARQFCWEATAKRAWQAMEARLASRTATVDAAGQRRLPAAARPRLAYLSPMPPERSGISWYSQDLLPELARWYDIELILTDASANGRQHVLGLPVRSVAAFAAMADRYDRVLYNMGNSEFHSHMLDLVERVPGIVVLHDAFLSNLLAYLEGVRGMRGVFSSALWESHGLLRAAVAEEMRSAEALARKYPCSLPMLQAALGVVFHSRHAEGLSRRWYPQHEGKPCEVLQLPRAEVALPAAAVARRRLGIGSDDFVCCAFGHLSPYKRNQDLIEAWQRSVLSSRPDCRLVFVGGGGEGGFGDRLRKLASGTRGGGNIRFTGWVDEREYHDWLATANLAVQLMTDSRGQTSAATLDCMNAGLPVLVSRHGANAEFPEGLVASLPDEASVAQIAEALDGLYADTATRREMGRRARRLLEDAYRPAHYAARLHAFIEATYRDGIAAHPLCAAQAVGRAAAALGEGKRAGRTRIQLAKALAANNPPAPRPRHVLVDVTAIVVNDLGTGPQRVVRELLRRLMAAAAPGLIIRPVKLNEARHFVYSATPSWADSGHSTRPPDEDIPIQPAPGDLFLFLDLNPHLLEKDSSEYVQTMRHRGVQTVFVVYDLLPVQLPHCFPAGAEGSFSQWLSAVVQADLVLCISEATAQSLSHWLESHAAAASPHLMMRSFPMGADLSATKGAPLAEPPESLPHRLKQAPFASPTFLMVGTVEPRKGHAQVLGAFEHLWQSGRDVCLVIVGRAGWMTEALCEQLRHHPRRGTHLFWLDNADDTVLGWLYRNCTALVAASLGEGFGLPLVEAAAHGLPLIARDIPIFREVAGDRALYFEDLQGEEGEQAVARTIERWLEQHSRDAHPKPSEKAWPTWDQSFSALLEALKPLAPEVVADLEGSVGGHGE